MRTGGILLSDINFIIGTNDDTRRNAIYHIIAKDMPENVTNIFLIVPDQISFQNEKTLSQFIEKHHITKEIQVLSFPRLCNFIFRALGGLAGDYIDDSTKMMIMGAALYKCSDNLSFYTKNIHSTSFVSKLLETDNELKNSDINVQGLDSLSNDTQSPVLKSKTRDLSVILKEYDNILSKSWIDPLTDISRACELLDKEYIDSTNPLSMSLIIFDGFTGFSAIQYQMIERLMKINDSKIYFSICIDEIRKPDGISLFSEPYKTVQKIKSLCDKLRIASSIYNIPAILENNKKVGAIQDIEHSFMRNHTKPEHRNNGEIELISASDPYDEANYVACKIRELAENGMRWNEITILTRDISIYEHALPDAFQKLQIPYFFDRNADISSHPLSAFVSSALAACRNNLDIQSIMRMMKTGILPLQEEEVSEFENYCYIWNIHGKNFLGEFTGNPRGYEEFKGDDAFTLEQINTIRENYILPLYDLKDKLGDADGCEFSSALYSFLCKCQVTKGLKNLYNRYFNKGDLAMANSLDSYWTYLISLIDKFSVSLKDVRLGLKNSTMLFESVLNSAKIGTLPQTVDCVTIGSSDRSKTYSPKAVFIMGCNDGIFPAKPSNSSLFTDKERKEIVSLGFDLSSSLDNFILTERVNAYNAFSSASDFLSVSWFRYNHSSEPMQKSILISYLKEIINPLEEKYTSSLPESFWLCNEEMAFDRLSQIGNISTTLSESLKTYFLSSEKWKDKIDKMGKIINTEEMSLQNKENTKKLFKENILLSPTSIETFESCPFKYYLQYGLQLKERRKAELSPLSTGNLIHHILEKIISKYGGKGLINLSDKEMKEEIDRIMKEYLDAVMDSDKNKTSRFKYLYGRIKSFAFKLCRRLGEEFNQSEFEPYAFELPLGKESEVPEYKLCSPDGKTVSVIGKIDRVDTFSRDGKKYVRIIDYKTGLKEFSLCDVYYGINIQMLVYLFSIWNGAQGNLSSAVPAGVLYMPAKDEVKTVERNKIESVGKELAEQKFQMNGLLLDDETVLNAMEPGLAGIYIPIKSGSKTSSESLASLAQLGQIKEHIDSLLFKLLDELTNGKIGAKPFQKKSTTSCDYCQFKNICRRNENMEYKEHKTFKNSDFYSIIKGGEENG